MFNKPNIPMRCRKFEARFEDYLGGAPDSELDDHLTHCAGLPRGAGRFAAGRQSASRGLGAGQRTEPGVPGECNGKNSSGRSAGEVARGVLGSARISGFAVVLDGGRGFARSFGLSGGICSAPKRFARHSIRTELSASDFPQPPGDPVSNEEVLQSLAERNNGN